MNSHGLTICLNVHPMECAMSDLPAQVLCELRDLIREKFPLRILGGKTEAAMLVARIDAADKSAVPVFYGISDLHDEIGAAREWQGR